MFVLGGFRHDNVFTAFAGSKELRFGVGDDVGHGAQEFFEANREWHDWPQETNRPAKERP